MGERGRPPRPTEEKRRLGNPGKRALPALATVVHLRPAEGVPDASQMNFGLDGLDLWEYIWKSGARWIAPATDLKMVVLACQTIDNLGTARRRYEATTDPQDGRMVVAYQRALVDALSALGFTPSGRTRLGVAEVTAVSKLDALRRNRQADAK